MRYRKQKEGESIEKYAAELEKLALEAYPDVQNIRANRNLIECFISGIRDDELAIKLLEENFNNLTETINRAVHYQQALQTRRFIKTETDFRPTMEKVYNISTDKSATINATDPKPAVQQQASTTIGNLHTHTNFQPQGHTHNPNQWYPNTGPPQYPQYPQYINSHQNYVPHQNFRSRQPQPNYTHENQHRASRQNHNQIVCYFCQKPGHIRPECYSYKKHKQRQKQDSYSCTYCNKQGHRADSCWFLIGFPNSKPIIPQNSSTNDDFNSKNPFRPT